MRLSVRVSPGSRPRRAGRASKSSEITCSQCNIFTLLKLTLADRRPEDQGTAEVDPKYWTVRGPGFVMILPHSGLLGPRPGRPRRESGNRATGGGDPRRRTG